MEFVIDVNLKTALKPELSLLNNTLEKLADSSDGFLGDLLHYVLIGSGKRVRPAMPSEAPMRKAKTGAAVGPAAKLMASPIGVVHVAGSPQCHRTWTRIMKTTASPRARSKARTRWARASPVTAFGAIAGDASIGATVPGAVQPAAANGQ